MAKFKVTDKCNIIPVQWPFKKVLTKDNSNGNSFLRSYHHLSQQPCPNVFFNKSHYSQMNAYCFQYIVVFQIKKKFEKIRICRNILPKYLTKGSFHIKTLRKVGFCTHQLRCSPSWVRDVVIIHLFSIKIKAAH